MKSSLLFVAVLLAVSCAPMSYVVGVEMRRPSKSGLALYGKSISVVYNDSGSVTDSIFAASLSGGFAEGLEDDYFSAEEAVGLFVRNADGDVNKEDMVDLLVDSGGDVLFLVNAESLSPITYTDPQIAFPRTSPDSSYVVKGTASFGVKIYVYDGMDARDTVLVYKGSGEKNPVAYISGNETEEEIRNKMLPSLAQEGHLTGESCSMVFKSSWVEENLTLIVFPSSAAWVKTANSVYAYHWEDAMNQWISMLDTKNLMRRSCLEYNIAVACYVLGKYDIAAEWLDRSDMDYNLELSSAMRRRIAAAQKQ